MVRASAEPGSVSGPPLFHRSFHKPIWGPRSILGGNINANRESWAPSSRCQQLLRNDKDDHQSHTDQACHDDKLRADLALAVEFSTANKTTLRIIVRR
jgi:hypothetical protein